MKTLIVGTIVHYQIEPNLIRPAMIIEVLDADAGHSRLQLFGGRFAEFVDAEYSAAPSVGKWHYPEGQ
jgi:hypothetical protein